MSMMILERGNDDDDDEVERARDRAADRPFAEKIGGKMYVHVDDRGELDGQETTP